MVKIIAPINRKIY